MVRITTGVGFLWLSASAAGAAPCVFDPDQITISPDASAISVPFDLFEATPDESAACDLSVPTGSMLAPGTFAVYSADYRGFVAEGDVAELTVEQEGAVDRAVIPGLQDGTEPFFQNYVGTFGDGSIDQALLLSLLRAADPATLTTLDSIDYALAATATQKDVEESLDGVAVARAGLVLHLQSTADLLTGGNRPLGGSDGVTVLGGVGSYLVGLQARGSLAADLTVDGGAGWFDLDAERAGAEGFMAAGALRYLSTGKASLRPFAEAGARAASLDARFERDYLNTRFDGDDPTGAQEGVSTSFGADGFFAGAYLEGGVVWTPDDSNEVSVSATLAHGRLETDAASEASGSDNLFAASFGEEETELNTIKVGSAWTSMLANGLDLTLSAAVGHGAAGGDIGADIAFVGAVEREAADDKFVEYGARLGLKPSERFKADLFVQGVSARESGTHVFYGGSLSHQF